MANQATFVAYPSLIKHSQNRSIMWQTKPHLWQTRIVLKEVIVFLPLEKFLSCEKARVDQFTNKSVPFYKQSEEKIIQFNSTDFLFFFLILDTYMFKSGTAANYLDIF